MFKHLFSTIQLKLKLKPPLLVRHNSNYQKDVNM